MRAAAIGAVAVLLAATAAGAAEFSAETSEDLKTSKEKTMTIKKNVEKKSSTTRKTGRSNSTGRDQTRSKSDKQSGTLGRNEALDLSLPAQAIFTFPAITYLLPVDFGWTGELPNGAVNTTRADFYRQRAGSNSTLEPEEQQKVRAYVNDIATTGAQIGQAMLNLQQDIGQIGKLERDGKGNIEVRGIGADDLQILATGAFLRSGNITDRRISAKLTEIRNDRAPCRFQGDTNRIQCGRASLDLATPPVLRIDGVEWFGSSFAGLSGSYKVSSSWSWAKALEDAKGDSRFEKFAKETAAAAEQLEAAGQSFDATMTRKKAVEKMKANKAGVGPGKFMPSIH